MISAEASDTLRAQCERLGVQAYLSKPVNYDAMLVAIKFALETPSEDAELVTLRLPARVLRQLAEVDPNLEHAITQLVEERQSAEGRSAIAMAEPK